MFDFGTAAGTPTVRLRAGPTAGVLELKLEHLLPSGSIFDRIAGPLLEQAASQSADRFLVAGCGSACLSFAAAARRQRSVVEFFLPADSLPEHEKLLRQHHAKLHRVPGGSLVRATEAALAHEASGGGRVIYAPGRWALSTAAWAETLARELELERADASGPAPTLFVSSGLSDLAMALAPRFQLRRVAAAAHGYQDGALTADEAAHEVVVDDRAAYASRRRLATEEGLLLGYSTAGLVHAARSSLEAGEISAALVVALDAGDRYFSYDGRFAAQAEV